MIRVTLIAGGVGGAKMAEGLAALDNVELSIIGNVADDAQFHGLWVSPDIDTMLYTLSGRINREQGWGVADEGQRALNVLEELGAPVWMFLGDKDFGLHIYRTERLNNGDKPSAITHDIATAFGIKSSILLPTDDTIQTQIRTSDGWISFQEYFVRERCAPKVLEIKYDGIETARITDASIDALKNADLIVIAPSNPLVSILPILNIEGMREAIISAPAPVIGVSPIIAGKVVKGPADKMLSSTGHRADCVGVANIYKGLAQHFVIDDQDGALAGEIASLGIQPHTTDILMPDASNKMRLATEILTLFEASKGRAA